MNEKSNEKTVETPVAQQPVVVAERPARIMGGLAIKTRIHAGKKAAAPGI